MNLKKSFLRQKSQENKPFFLKKGGTEKSKIYSSKITLLQQQLTPILCSAVTGIKDMRKNEEEIILSFLISS